MSTPGGANRPAASSRMATGNLQSAPADIMEMEDWEVAPGTIAERGDNPEGKYSSYLTLHSTTPRPPATNTI